MTKKDLFRIIIKLFGLYAAINFITVYLAQLTSFAHFFKEEPLIILWVLLAILLFCGFASLIIFYPNKIINWFSLNKGYDNDDASLGKTDLKSLIKIAVIITGGLFILNSFAPLLVEIAHILPSLITKGDVAEMVNLADHRGLYTDIINLAIGYLLLANYSPIATFLTKKDNNSVKVQD